MDFQTFKELHEDDTIVNKIYQLVKTMEIMGNDRVASVEAQRNRNERDERYWANEVRAMNERAEWLYGEIIRELDPDGIMEG